MKLETTDRGYHLPPGIQTYLQGLAAVSRTVELGRDVVPLRGPHLLHKVQERTLRAFYLMVFLLLTVELEICPNL